METLQQPNAAQIELLIQSHQQMFDEILSGKSDRQDIVKESWEKILTLGVFLVAQPLSTSVSPIQLPVPAVTLGAFLALVYFHNRAKEWSAINKKIGQQAEVRYRIELFLQTLGAERISTPFPSTNIGGIAKDAFTSIIGLLMIAAIGSWLVSITSYSLPVNLVTAVISIVAGIWSVLIIRSINHERPHKGIALDADKEKIRKFEFID